MSSVLAPRGALTLPPAILYAEPDTSGESWIARLGQSCARLPGMAIPAYDLARLRWIVRATARHRAEFAALDEAELADVADALRIGLRRRPFHDPLVARAFALIRETARRTLGMTHYDVQLIAGLAMIRGMLAEQETGEGKTLTATLPTVTAALSGIPVHVVTANDYLARRDAEMMAPLYRALGLTVGVVAQGLSQDERRAAYACDVTYCTNKEVAFDYLRDRIVLGGASSNLKLKLERLYDRSAPARGLVMRGLHFAIVDEADSVLVDEARTPLIISGLTDPGDERVQAEQAIDLAGALDEGIDYLVNRNERSVELTPQGRERLAGQAEALAGPWRGALFREEQVRNALSALHLFRRDEHYLVRNDKIEIVDEYTGRTMADRSWGDGLHQIVEVKEGCTVTGRTVTVARMTYQRFFRRYRILAGMTGTAREAKHELWHVYRLPVVTVPTNRPARRMLARPAICRTLDEKWDRVARRTRALAEAGVPVLVGTRSVSTSEILSAVFDRAGITHVVLNAAQDENEAEIVARAGRPGHVTIATNMAGRGVDVALGAGVAEAGGLHVIMTERHDARRIDRQLFGRCARQGEPGRVEVILSLDDPLAAEMGRPRLVRLCRGSGAARALLGNALFGLAQRRAERAHARIRRDLLAWDRNIGRALAFTGRQE